MELYKLTPLRPKTHVTAVSFFTLYNANFDFKISDKRYTCSKINLVRGKFK